MMMNQMDGNKPKGKNNYMANLNDAVDFNNKSF